MRLGSGVLDAGLSSVGNLAVSLLASQRLPLAQFGLLAAAMLIGLILVGASRALLGDPLNLRYAGAGAEQQGAAVRRVTAAGFSAGLLGSPIAAMVVYVASLVAGADQTTAFWLAIALLVTGPLLVVQELMRAVAYSTAWPLRALPNTVVWTVALIAVLVALNLAGIPLTAAGYLFVWGATAGLGAAVGLSVNRLAPQVGELRSWWSEDPALIRRLGLDYSLTQITAESSFVLIAMVAGAEEAGLLRKAQMPLAPIVILTSGIMLIGQPGLVRRVQQGQPVQQVRRLAYRIGLLAGAVSICAGLALLLVPVSWMNRLLGGDWEQARLLVPLFSLYLALGAIAACQGVALRALGRLSQQVRLRVLLTPIVLAMITLGALGKALGAVAGLCLSVALVVFAWTVLLRRDRERGRHRA